jgi:hypothetical protein
MSSRIPSVFVAYEHGSLTHAQRVRALADRLRMEGIDVILDQYVDDPPEGWQQWTRRQILEREVVLLVYTPAHGEPLESERFADRWKHHVEQARGPHEFLLILFEDGTEHDVPWARSWKRFRLPEDYDRLHRLITGWNGSLPLPSSEARSGGGSWEEQISAAQHAGAIEAQESTDRLWSHASGPDDGLEDHLWDTGSAAALGVLARRIPVTTRGSTIIADGRVRYKQRPLPRCPDCGGALRSAVVSVRFELAPEPTAVQEVAGYRCACGSEWPDPFVMRAAHAAAFGSSAQPRE